MQYSAPFCWQARGQEGINAMQSAGTQWETVTAGFAARHIPNIPKVKKVVTQAVPLEILPDLRLVRPGLGMCFRLRTSFVGINKNIGPDGVALLLNFSTGPAGIVFVLAILA